MQRSSTPTQDIDHGTESDDNSLSNDEGVPVNKTTSFNGGLGKYMHISQDTTTTTTTTTTIPSREKTKRLIDTLDAESTPKRKRGVVTTSETSVHRRILTRSRSSTTITTLSGSESLTTTTSANSSPKKKSRKNGAPPSSSPISHLQDTIPPNLTLLLVGVNPGIMTGATGFAYAHPSNLFWKLLHSSGITPIRHPPSDTYRLPELYNIGNTNIVERPTRDASMLSKAEMEAGVPILEAKVAAKQPEAVCLVGKSIWEAVWRARKGRAIRKEEFRYGWQDESENMGRSDGWAGARVFVATTTSGLAASMTLAQKEAVWNELGGWVVGRRGMGATGAGL